MLRYDKSYYFSGLANDRPRYGPGPGRAVSQHALDKGRIGLEPLGLKADGAQLVHGEIGQRVLEGRELAAAILGEDGGNGLAGKGRIDAHEVLGLGPALEARGLRGQGVRIGLGLADLAGDRLGVVGQVEAEDVAKLKAIQKEIHEHFIALVKARRGDKLDSRESALFTGEYWTGSRARELGLVDAIGDLRETLRARYGEKVQTPLIVDRGFLGRKMPGVALEGLFASPSLAEDFVATLEARALWSRYGL